jgi:hypothetical protein
MNIDRGSYKKKVMNMKKSFSLCLMRKNCANFPGSKPYFCCAKNSNLIAYYFSRRFGAKTIGIMTICQMTLINNTQYNDKEHQYTDQYHNYTHHNYNDWTK